MGLEAVGLHYHAFTNFFITKAEYGNFHVNLNVPVQLFPDNSSAWLRSDTILLDGQHFQFQSKLARSYTNLV